MGNWLRRLTIFGVGLFLIGAALPAAASTGDKEIIIKGFTDESDGRGWMGVHLQELTSGLAEAMEIDGEGVLVSDVSDDSPADKAGLKSQDVILSINGGPVRDVDELMDTMADTEPGEKIVLKINREGREKELEVTLGEAPEMKKEIFIQRFDDDSDSPDWHMLQRFPPGLKIFEGFSSKPKARLGVTIMEPDPDLAAYFDISEGGGVLITGIMEESAAEKAGLKSGDVILSVDGDEVSSTEELHQAIGDAEPGDVELKILRKGKKMDFTAHLEDSDTGKIHGFMKHPPGKSKKFEWHSDEGEHWVFDHDDAQELHEDLGEQLEHLRDQLKELEKEMKELKKSIKD